MNRKSFIFFILIAFSILLPSMIFAQGVVISDIGEAVNKLSRILLVVIAACGVWSGLKLAKGDHDAIPRLIGCVAGAIVVGLTLAELSVLAAIYVCLAELLSFWAYGIFVALLLTCAGFALLAYLHRKHESHYVLKWIRFAGLPAGLSRTIIGSQKEIKSI